MNTEFSTALAAGFRPKDTLETPSDDLAVRQFPGDSFDCVQRLDRQLAIILVAGAHGEGQWIEYQVGGGQAMLVDGEIIEPMRQLHFRNRRPWPCRFHRW